MRHHLSPYCLHLQSARTQSTTPECLNLSHSCHYCGCRPVEIIIGASIRVEAKKGSQEQILKIRLPPRACLALAEKLMRKEDCSMKGAFCEMKVYQRDIGAG